MNIQMSRFAVDSGIAFPLTLPLSPEERGRPMDVLGKIEIHRALSSRGFATRLGAFLPLPKEAGWGEGKVVSIRLALDTFLQSAS